MQSAAVEAVRKTAGVVGTSTMSREQARIGAVAIAAVCLAIYAGWRTAPSSPPPTHPPAAVATESPLEIEGLDFGEAWEQPAFPWEIKLRNRTASPLVIQQVQTSCECTDLSPRFVTLPPNGEQVMQLTLKLLGSESELLPREFDVNLTFEFADGKTPMQTVVLHGEVLPIPIRIESRQLNLGEIVISNDSSFERSVRLSSRVELPTPTVTCAPSELAALSLIDLPNSQTDKDLRITLQRELAVGPLALDVCLKYPRPLDQMDQNPMILMLPFRGDVVGDVEAIPRTVLLGALPVNSTIDEVVTFQSRTGRMMKSWSPETIPEGFELSLVESAALPASYVTMRLVGKVPATGEQTPEIVLQFQVEGFDRPVRTTVLVSYHGINGSPDRVTP